MSNKSTTELLAEASVLAERINRDRFEGVLGRQKACEDCRTDRDSGHFVFRAGGGVNYVPLLP